jgi:hypothetical protein
MYWTRQSAATHIFGRIMLLPDDVCKHIHRHLMNLYEQERKQLFLQYGSGVRIQEECREDCSELIGMLMSSFDIREFGYSASAGASPFCVAKQLEGAIDRMKTNLANLRSESSEYYIEINIMNNLLKNSVRVQKQIGSKRSAIVLSRRSNGKVKRSLHNSRKMSFLAKQLGFP